MSPKIGLVAWAFAAGWVAQIIIDLPPFDPSLWYLDVALWLILFVDIVQVARYYQAIK